MILARSSRAPGVPGPLRPSPCTGVSASRSAARRVRSLLHSFCGPLPVLLPQFRQAGGVLLPHLLDLLPALDLGVSSFNACRSAKVARVWGRSKNRSMISFAAPVTAWSM